MNKKIVGIFAMTLLIAVSVLPVSGTLNNIQNNNSVIVQTDEDTGWIELDKIIASDGQMNEWFGYSVLIDGDYAIMGAPGDNSYKGSAYIFKRDGASWTQQAKLLASDGAYDDEFGYSVSINGDYAIIGASYDNDNGFCSGSAYIFKRDGTSWTQQAKLLASDGIPYDEFGISVSIDGDYAIIGADGHMKDFLNGSAYIFKRDGTNWNEEAKLLASDGEEDDEFGYSVSINGDYAIIGAPCDNIYKGSAYIFKRDGTNWNEEAKLLASDGAPEDCFGDSVSINGDYAIIGADGDDDNGECSGSAYIFKRDGTSWNEEAKLLASDGALWDAFGASVSINGDYAIIGAFGDCDNGYDSGSAYIFRNIYEDQAPNAPTITGPSSGNIGTSYDYNFTSVDPDGDDIAEYIVNWGDNTGEETITGPFASGTLVTQSHTWASKGAYIIKAKAKDIYGAESEWGTLSVTMPKNYQSSQQSQSPSGSSQQSQSSSSSQLGTTQQSTASTTMTTTTTSATTRQTSTIR